MNVFQIAIAAGATLAMVLSWRLPHAFMWICIGTVNAVACDIFYSYNLPYPAAFTLALDALMCLTIHWFAKEKWESGLYIIFQFSVLMSVFHLGGLINDDDAYRLALELCNWAALLMIAGTAMLGGIRDRAFYRSWRSYFSGAYRYLRSPPETNHWRKAS